MKTIHVLTAMLLAALGAVAQAAPFTVSADGSEVSDAKTGLIWRRCAQGMTAGLLTCTGTASTFNHEAALAHARDQAASTGVAWRLPNVRELASLMDRSKIGPAIDSEAFPGLPTGSGPRFWSSTPNVNTPLGYAWHVGIKRGNVAISLRTASWPVLLVRAGQ